MRALVADTWRTANVRPFEALAIGTLVGLLTVCGLCILDAYLPTVSPLARVLFGE